MNTIFDYLNDILFHKKGNKLDNIDDHGQYNPYMINRWLSMYSPNVATIINETTNKYYSIFDTKPESYNFLVKIIPKQKPFRIRYIKKVKAEKDDTAQVIDFLSESLEISKREIRYYIESNNIDIEELKKTCH